MQGEVEVEGKGGGPARAGLVVALTLAVGLSGGCGSDPVGPEDELTVSFSTENFVFHMAPGDAVNASWQEAYFGWLTGEIGVDAPSGPIHYYKYRNRSELHRLTGEDTNGFAEPGRLSFHTIFDRDNHEVVHTLVVSQIGSAPALLNEGIAVAHHGRVTSGPFAPDEPYWGAEQVHTIAARRMEMGQLPDLDVLLESRDFFDFTNDQVYPIAGSFVRYLIDQVGIQTFKEYIETASFDDARATTRAKFLDAYGESVDTWWGRWRGMLAGS